MNLSRTELIRAKDRQLLAVGITRKQSKGWLRLALLRDFTEGEIERFKNALYAENISTPKAELSERARLLIEARDTAARLATIFARLVEVEAA